MIDVDELVHRTAADLIAVWKGAADSPSLRFPRRRNDVPRVSEQEARVLMCQVLEKARVPYAVEWPTEGRYAFSQEGGETDEDTGMSARTDLAVLDDDTDDRSAKPAARLAVEFKSAQPRQPDIDKDMRKLVREEVPGLWFHTLEASNSGTIGSLFRKLDIALRNEVDLWRRTRSEPVPAHRITVAVVVLSGKQIGLWTLVTAPEDGISTDEDDWTRTTL